MNKLLLTLFMLGTLLLSACASKPPPDWQNNAFAALNSFTSAYLNGNTKVAEFEFARAKTEVARTGRADLMARLELSHCAAQVASLDLQPCAGYDALALDAQPAEQAYSSFISGRWNGLDPALLSRLIAAGSLLQKEQLTPVDIGLAVKTASDQGWRRPLLAWLGLQLKHQQTAGNTSAASETQRRIDLVLQTPAK